jgi:hypothetical protein
VEFLGDIRIVIEVEEGEVGRLVVKQQDNDDEKQRNDKRSFFRRSRNLLRLNARRL